MKPPVKTNDIFLDLAKIYSTYNYLVWKSTNEVERQRHYDKYRPQILELMADWVLKNSKK